MDRKIPVLHRMRLQLAQVFHTAPPPARRLSEDKLPSTSIGARSKVRRRAKLRLNGDFEHDRQHKTSVSYDNALDLCIIASFSR
jgi:hypothetical protein